VISTLAVPVAAGVLGLFLGGRVTRVAPRLLDGSRPLAGRSVCDSCGAGLPARRQIPVVSWLLLGGRCADCAAPIPVRYPLVEAATATTFATLGGRFGVSADLAVYGLAALGLLVVTVTDLQAHLIPRRVLYVDGLAMAAVMVAVVAVDPSPVRVGDLWHAFAAGAVGLVVFATVHAVSPRGFRFGDVRAGAFVTFTLGWSSPAAAYVAILVALFAAVAVGVVVMARTAQRNPGLPLAPFLTFGAIVAVCVPLSGLR